MADKRIVGTQTTKQTPSTQEIEKFVSVYYEDKLFDCIPGREHSAYPGFTYQCDVKEPAKLKARLVKYSGRLDKDRAAMLY